MDSLEEVRIGVAGGETDTATLDTTEPGKVESEEPVPACAALVEPTPIEAPSDLAGDDAVPVQTPAPSKSAPTIDETPSGAPAVDSSEVAAPLIPEASPRTEPTAMGPDYGNAEGVDISPPLPAAWSSVASLPPVVVYGEVLSPPSCKVRALLAFYGVPFTVSGKRRPGSTYAKRPHITIGTGAEMRQVNDSVVIFRTLGKPGRRSEVIFRHMRALLRTRPPCYAAGILSGAPVPAAAADLDRELSAEFPLAVEIECFTGMSSPEIDAYVRLDRECVGTHGGCLEVALASASVAELPGPLPAAVASSGCGTGCRTMLCHHNGSALCHDRTIFSASFRGLLAVVRPVRLWPLPRPPPRGDPSCKARESQHRLSHIVHGALPRRLPRRGISLLPRRVARATRCCRVRHPVSIYGSRCSRFGGACGE